MPATARVHRRDQLHPRRKGDVGVGPRDADHPRLQRLAQRIEHAALEFRKFVEEQHAEMRKADLAGLHLQPPARQRRHRRAVMRAAKGPIAGQAPAGQGSGDGLHHRYLQRLHRVQWRQYSRQARCHQRLAGARWADHQQVMTTCRCDFQRALGDFLPLDLAQVGPVRRGFDIARGWCGEQAMALEMVDERQQVGCRKHLHRSSPSGLRSLRRGTDQPPALARGIERGEQHARRRRNPTVQPQFADDDIVRERLDIDHGHGAEQRQRDRKIEVRSFLRQIGRRQVDDDALGRQREAQRGDRAAHPFAAFRDRLVAQPDDDEVRQAGNELHLHLDAPRLQPEIGHRLDDRHHVIPLRCHAGVTHGA